MLPLALQGSLMLMVLAVGLDASMREAMYVFRRPGVLVRSVLAFAVAVPLFAGLVVAALPLDRAVVPLAVGMLIRHLAPAAAARAAPPAARVANILLLLTLLPILFGVLPTLLHLIGNGTVAAMAVVVLGALLAGHLLGGPEAQDQAALAIACTTRHPGVALLVAHANFADPEIKAAILWFVIVGVLVGLPYQAWYKRHRLALQ
jgi:BASS family bile acid:Na+ symporter